MTELERRHHGARNPFVRLCPPNLEGATLTDAQKNSAANFAELKPMLDRAERDGLWLVLNNVHTGTHWMTPANVRKDHVDGKFIWGIINWEARHPKERTVELKKVIRDAKADLLAHHIMMA